MYITDWIKLRRYLLALNHTAIHYRLEEITPLVTGVKPYIQSLVVTAAHTIPTGRNYAVANGVKTNRYTSPTGRNYAISYWRKILRI